MVSPQGAIRFDSGSESRELFCDKGKIMDFGLATFILVLSVIVLWALVKLGSMAIEADRADRRAKQTIKRLIEVGNETRLTKLRDKVSEFGAGAAKNFARMEQEVRKEIQQQRTATQPTETLSSNPVTPNNP